jgi:hypothetical protein
MLQNTNNMKEPDPLDDADEFMRWLGDCTRFKYICLCCGYEICGCCECATKHSLHSLTCDNDLYGRLGGGPATEDMGYETKIRIMNRVKEDAAIRRIVTKL